MPVVRIKLQSGIIPFCVIFQFASKHLFVMSGFGLSSTRFGPLIAFRAKGTNYLDNFVMVMSINTNVGAMAALRNLSTTNQNLDDTQLRITTGLKINGPKDDASTYAIAQRMRGDIAGMQSVKTALANGESTVNVAITAAKAISELLIELKAKVVQGLQSSLDTDSRTALNDDFTALRDQIDSTVFSASFNGVNLIENGSTDLSVLSTVDGSTITITSHELQAINLQFGQAFANLNSESNANQTRTLIDNAIVTVTNALASLGAAAKRIEVQKEFTGSLVDILKEGVGSLVDADLAEESAELQSLQIKQQLGVQALSISNSSPRNILSLFGG